MNTISLVEITTKDGLIHQGIFAESVKKSKTAVLWMHGLSGNFYGNVTFTNILIEMCESKGIGFASFNNRGHDSVSGIKKIDASQEKGYTRVVGGAGIERFEECAYDIDAGISFLSKKGFTKIILVGHSTGANKACYYAGTQNDPRVSGVVLASPVNDRLVPKNHVSWVTKSILSIIRAIGMGNSFITLAGPYPVTPNRALSLMTKRSAEDVFDYDDHERGLKVFGQITKPLFVLLGELDESLDRPAFVIKSVYDKKTNAKKYASIIFSDADHGFTGKEKEFSETIIRWVQSLR